MQDETDAKRVYWHSRRGMLELDLVLMPFAERVYPQLAAADQAAYKRLLECEDPELFRWLLGHGVTDDEQLSGIITKILSYAHQS
ncbi:MAG: succinate dehydrogenase assembly factor 2 [Pseudomonadales bacterium]